MTHNDQKREEPTTLHAMPSQEASVSLAAHAAYALELMLREKAQLEQALTETSKRYQQCLDSITATLRQHGCDPAKQWVLQGEQLVQRVDGHPSTTV